MANEVKELNNQDLQEVSDSEVLALAEQIITTELKKSKDSNLEGDDENEKLGKTQGNMPEVGQGSIGEAPQEANAKNKKKKDGEDMKKSQADIEGHETGGLAPSVQGNLPSADPSQGDSQDEANAAKDVFTRANGAEDKEEEEKNKNKKKGPTQDGDSQDEANAQSVKPGKLAGGNGVPAIGDGGGHETQQGDSQDKANMMKSEIEDLKKLVKGLADTVKVLASKDTLSKSTTIHADVLEKLSKSYLKQIDEAKAEKEELKKSFDAKFAELTKSQEELKKSNDEMQKALSKPARTRESLSNVQEIKKGGDEGRKLFKSKAEILAKLEELRKSGKVTGDDIISYNASNHLTDAAKKALFE